jgi:RNA polymerase sigma-70 factor (ECF subfamily)
MDKYQGMVYAEALRFTKNHDEAEDLTQEIFLKAFESLSLFKGHSKFPTWLYRIGKNLALTKYRKEKNSPLHSLKEFNSEEIPDLRYHSILPESEAIDSELNDKVRTLLSRLPVAYKKPLILFYFENMSYKEISEHLDIKINTLKSYILRGKDLMKKWMTNEE